MSRPSAIFFSGGQIVAMLNATSSTINVIASKRFRSPRSVAKYHPNKTSKPTPAKKVNPGLISTLRRLQHIRDRRFLHLDLHIIGHLQHHRRLLYIGDEAVNAGVGDNSIACLQTRNQFLLLLLPLLLRTQHYEVHDDKNKNQRHEKPDPAPRACRRRLCLS